MAFYTNTTRHTAIVTLKINTANDLKGAIKVGITNAQGPVEVALGYNDVPVPAGASIELADGTDAALFGVRTGD